jgi:hypothetical protein
LLQAGVGGDLRLGWEGEGPRCSGAVGTDTYVLVITTKSVLARSGCGRWCELSHFTTNMFDRNDETGDKACRLDVQSVASASAVCHPSRCGRVFFPSPCSGCARLCRIMSSI